MEISSANNVSLLEDFRDSCHFEIFGQDLAKRAHFRPIQNLEDFSCEYFNP